MDELTLKAWVSENEAYLVGARVVAVRKGPGAVVELELDTPGGPRSLTLAAGGRGAVFHSRPLRRERPPRVRSRLEGTVIRAVRQRGDDRVLAIRCDAAADDFTLWVELFGGSGLVCVIREGRVVERLAGRKLALGSPFTADARPPRRPASALTAAEVAALDPDTFVRQVAYASPAASRLVFDGGQLVPAWWEAFAAAAGGASPAATAVREGEEWVVYVFGEWGAVPAKSFRAVNGAVAFAYTRNAAQRQFETVRAAVLKRLYGRRDRLRRQVEAVAAERERYRDYQAYLEMGEALKRNLAAAPRGTAVVAVPNLAGGEVLIELLPHLDALQNMERFFKMYRRGKRGLEATGVRLAALAEELARVESEIKAVGAAGSGKDLARWGETKPGAPRPVAGTRGPGRRYLSSDGYTVLVGRNAADNDAITFGVARPHDLWLHAHQTKGSHVVVRRDDKNAPVPRRTVLEAAALAAFYSEARRSGLVPVAVVERRYLRKVKGKPGMVTYHGGDVVDVAPGEVIKPIY